MAKFYGEVGYGAVSETPHGTGVWVDKIVEKVYYGDVTRNSRSMQAGERLHDEITANNTISIVADAYANEHFFNIRYVRWAGALWSVSTVEVQSPRLLLTLGGVYNGPTPESTPGSP